MRYAALLLFLLAFQASWSQKEESHFEYSSVKLEKVLTDIELQFNIKYSYADSLAATKIITLASQKYTLEQLNAEIESQTSLTVAKIDERYYSIYKKAGDAIQSERLQEILVKGFLSEGINKVNQKVIIYPQKLEALPGVTDADILLSLQQLPGVKSPNETASGLHVRGGTSDQNSILWDGIRMYHPGHLFGMISGYNPNVEQTVNYYNKATNPKFGERVSSVIDIKPTDKIADRLKISAGINALNADVYVRTPLVKNKLGLQLAGRKSYTEWLQSPTFNSLAEKVFQNTNFKDFNDRNRFQFQDYSAKLNFSPNAKSEFSVTGILIDNHLNFNTPSGNLDKNQMMNIRNYGLSANWSEKYSEKFSQKLLLHYSAYTFDYEKKQQFSANEFEAFSKLNRIVDSGLELNFEYAFADNLDVEFGYQLSGNAISHSFTTQSQDVKIDLDQKNLFNITHTGFSYFKYALSTWKFQAGARYSDFIKLQANSFEPRIFIQKQLTEGLTAQVSYEKKSQIMSQFRESVTNDLSLENYVWILSDNAAYPIQRADQFNAGLIYKTKSWLLDIDAYYKTIDGITSLSFGFLHQYDSEIRKGSGFTKGIDFLIQKSAPDWRAWITYTYQDSQNKYEGLNDDRYFPINSDSKHALSISFYKKWGNYSAALGWFWHTGKPYSLLNASDEIVSFNRERLPAYHRLDLSAAYQFRDKESWSGKAGFSIFNAYNKHAVISREYERDYTTIGSIIDSKYTIQDYYSLGFTPNIFIRISL